jgi:hypothetical protein
MPESNWSGWTRDLQEYETRSHISWRRNLISVVSAYWKEMAENDVWRPKEAVSEETRLKK